MSDPSAVFALLIFLGMIACVHAGLAVARKKRQAEEAENEGGTGLIVGTLFTLLGLLLAFTLSASAGRLDARRAASLDEANAIGTACLRLDLLAEDDRVALQRLYIEFIDDRLQFNAALSSRDNGTKANRKLQFIESEIWKRATAASQGEAKILLLPAINESFDDATNREVLAETYTPSPLFWFLVVLSLLSAFLVGEATEKISRASAWAYRIVFCLAITIALFIVTDLDNPRVGFIRIDYVDTLLTSTRDSLKSALPSP